MPGLRNAITTTAALMCIGVFAFAADATDRTLNNGQVHFSVPAGWSAIMEKTDGDPQAIVFQVPDPAIADGAETASVTVKTRSLQSPAEFAGAVQAEFDLSKAQPGYELDRAHSEGSAHQYFVQRGKTRYLVRDSFFLTGTIAVQVRCQRPLIDAAPPSWIEMFESGCASVFASLKQAPR
ncbi:MAG: hypothetical protein WBW61_02185 [Rhodanobacteraceae bacterium]